jgi:hypothetical protein
MFRWDKKIQPNSKQNQQKTNSIITKQNKKLTKPNPIVRKKNSIKIRNSISPSL